tara:strand:+ start:592 stop:990 length:399 start_codon:yes stop_codon:yes gene_type:complete
MRFVLLSLSIFLFITKSQSQSLAGHWRWINKPEDRSFEIELAKPKTGDSVYDFVGEHCGVYYNGGRLDCSEEISISLKKEKGGVFIGTIRSAYSDSTSRIKLTILSEEKQIRWEVTDAKGQFYFPYEAILER